MPPPAAVFDPLGVAVFVSAAPTFVKLSVFNIKFEKLSLRKLGAQSQGQTSFMVFFWMTLGFQFDKTHIYEMKCKWHQTRSNTTFCASPGFRKPEHLDSDRNAEARKTAWVL